MPAGKVPEGFNTVTPSLIVQDCAKAIDTYTKALGAKELYRMEAPNSKKIMHACLQLGTSKIFLADASPESGCAMPTTSNFYLYFDDVDAMFKQATQGGMQKFMEPQDMFWGDRTGAVKDSFGNTWTLASHVRDVSPQEMEEAKKKFSPNKAA